MSEPVGSMRCPHCNKHVIQTRPDGHVFRIHGPLTVENGECKTRCFWCEKPVVLPLKIQPIERFIARVDPPGS